MVCVLAFSLQAQVEKYGAYVGIASFLGLALLSILYFAQAREVRRLRDWAGRAPERDADLEARVSAEASRRVQPAPAKPAVAKPAPATAAAAAQDTQITAPPEPVPAGNGRPAGPVAVPMGPRPALAAERVAAAVGAAAAARESGAAEEPEAAPAPAATAVVDAPASAPAEEPAPAPPAAGPPSGEGNGAAGDGDGTGEAAAVVPRATPRPPAPEPKRPAAQPLRQTGRSAAVPPRRATKPPVRRPAPAAAPAPERGRHRRGIVVGVLAGVIVLAAAALIITQLGGGKPSTVPNTTVPAPNATATATATAGATAVGGPSKAQTTVVILNGTTTDGLAGTAKASLEQGGYQTDHIPTVTSSNQTVTRSTVYYAPGRRTQATDAAGRLKIASIQPLDPNTRALAENSTPTPVKADVVVILGADRNP
jgi:hypothetical protein